MSSNALYKNKLEQRRAQALSRQEQRKNNLKLSTQNSFLKEEPVEYLYAYDNEAASISKPKKTKKPSQKSKKKPIHVDDLFEQISDEESIASAPRRIEGHKLKEFIAQSSESDGERTPTNEQVQNNEQLFVVSDESSEEGDMRDDISIAPNRQMEIRPQTAQSVTRPATSLKEEFNKIPDITPPKASRSSTRSMKIDVVSSINTKNSTSVCSEMRLSPTASYLPNPFANRIPLQPTTETPFTFIPGMEDIQSLKEFCYTSAPFEFRDQPIKARITRSKGSKLGGKTRYFMHLEMPNGNKFFLMSAYKRSGSKTSNYLISTEHRDIDRNSDAVIGKLRSNMVGTKFVVYDNGLSPDSPEALRDYSRIRQEMALILYETNILGFHGPRKMTLVIPGMDEEKKRVVVKPMSESESLSERVNKGADANLITLENKKPMWNEDTQSFVLNFHGRVTIASVKNFQVIHKDDSNYIIMQFGRIADDTFTIDYRYPLCAFQTFAIALSSFDSKLACE